MSTDDRMETITDPALIRATDDPDERGDFPCCADRAHKESLGGDSESGTYNRSNRPPAGPCTDERTTPAPVSGAGLDLDAIERRANGATPGWWQEVDDLDGGWQVLSGKGEEITGSGLPIADAEFIATLDPPTVLALVAEVRRLTEDIDQCWVPLYHDTKHERDQAEARAESAEAEVVTLRARLAEAEALHWKVGGACSHCSQRSDYAVAWPCETAVALAGTTGEGE